MRNYLKYTLWLTLLVWAILLSMSFIPPITFFGYTFKKIDILGDIRPDLPQEEPDTFLINVPTIKPAFIDTCLPGITCIEDYSDSTLKGMAPFYKILDEIALLNRPVRIAVLGDSFTEGDILTADLRELLQNRYGGCGVGYVDITSATNTFRPTVKHSFGGWKRYSQKESGYFDPEKQSISGRYFKTVGNSFVDLKGQSKYASRLDTCEHATIYFYCDGLLNISAKINDKTEITESFDASDNLQSMSVKGKIGSVRWKVDTGNHSTFYGVALDGEKGISVDNLSLRGSSGMSISKIPAKTLKDFNDLRQYDLIILQYGLNIVTPGGFDYEFYRNGMKKSIDHLKECFPHAGILLLSIGDRMYRSETDQLRTTSGVKNLVKYQNIIAAENHIAFWNMFEAMGGAGSMAKLVHATPPQANYDYTHINFKGGKVLAELLFETIVYGKEQYDRRKIYEEE